MPSIQLRVVIASPNHAPGETLVKTAQALSAIFGSQHVYIAVEGEPAHG